MNGPNFQKSLLNAILDLTPDLMIAGVVLALMLSLATAHLYAFLNRRKAWQDSASVLSGMMLAPVLIAMVVCMGYTQLRIDRNMAVAMGDPKVPVSRPHGFDWRRNRPSRFPGPMMHLSLTHPFFRVADTNNDGQLSLEEAAEFIRSADTDGDGQIDAEVLETTVRIRSSPSVTSPSLEDVGNRVAHRARPDSPPGS